MFVPKVGLVDGMVLDIHERWKREKAKKNNKSSNKKKRAIDPLFYYKSTRSEIF